MSSSYAVQTDQGKFDGKTVSLGGHIIRLEYEAVYGRNDNYNIYIDNTPYGVIWLTVKSEDGNGYWVGNSYDVRVLQIEGLPVENIDPDPDIVSREANTETSSEAELTFLMKCFVGWAHEGIPTLLQAQRVRALAEQRVRNPDSVRETLQSLLNRLTLAKDLQPGEAEALDWVINSSRSGFSL